MSGEGRVEVEHVNTRIFLKYLKIIADTTVCPITVRDPGIKKANCLYILDSGTKNWM